MSSLNLQVTRGTPETGQSMVDYVVPYWQGMSLLDALLWIREHQDPTVAVRYSCRSANACKECSANIDGRTGYLCNTKGKPDTTVQISPLNARTWIRDLVTDLD